MKRQLKFLVGAVSVLGISGIGLGQQTGGVFQSQDPLLNENNQPMVVTSDKNIEKQEIDEDLKETQEHLERKEDKAKEEAELLCNLYDEVATNFSTAVSKVGGEKAESAIVFCNEGIRLQKQAFNTDKGAKRAELNAQAAEAFDKAAKVCGEFSGMEVGKVIAICLMGHSLDDQADSVGKYTQEQKELYRASVKKFDQVVDESGELSEVKIYRADALYSAGHLMIRLANTPTSFEEDLIGLYSGAGTRLIKAAHAYSEIPGMEVSVADAYSLAGTALRGQAYNADDRAQREQLCLRAAEQFAKAAEVYGQVGMEEEQKEQLSSIEGISLNCPL